MQPRPMGPPSFSRAKLAITNGSAQRPQTCQRSVAINRCLLVNMEKNMEPSTDACENHGKSHGKNRNGNPAATSVQNKVVSER